MSLIKLIFLIFRMLQMVKPGNLVENKKHTLIISLSYQTEQIMSSDVHKRMQLLSSYIKKLADNVNNNDMHQASIIVQANKKKVDNNTILKFAFQSQLIQSLTKSNEKLKKQVESLRNKKTRLQKQNRQSEISLKSRLINQKVGVSNVRFKITFSDTDKIQFQSATLQIKFETLVIFNYEQQSQKQLKFADFLVVEKKNTHVLVEYENQGQRRFLMIQCFQYDQALRIFRSLSFGKLIKQNQHRKSLFIEQQIELENEEMINLSESIYKQKEKSKDNELSKQLLSSHQNSNHNLLHLGYKNNRVNEKTHQHVNNLKISPFFLLNRSRAGSNIFHSQLSPSGGQNNHNNSQVSDNLRKYSVDDHATKMLFQNILGKQKNDGISHNSFDNSNSHNSQSNPSSPVQYTQMSLLKLDSSSFNPSKSIIQRQKQKQQLLQHFASKQKLSRNNFRETNFNIQQKDDQYKSKSSQNNREFRHSKDSNFSNDMPFEGQKNQHQLSIKRYQAPFSKNILVQNDFISEKSEQQELSFPSFPKKINYQVKQQQIKKRQSLESDLQKIQNQEVSSQRVESGNGYFPEDYNQGQDSQDNQDAQYNHQGNQSQSSEQSENSSTDSTRKNILQSGLIMTKCSVNGFNSHQKHVKLSQNQMQLVYQDTKDRKKKTVSLNEIDKVQYMVSGPGISKHIKHVDLDYCMIINVKEGKFSKGKPKTLEFYAEDKQSLERFCRYLAQFVEAIQKK